jgi:hypothetical protein
VAKAHINAGICGFGTMVETAANTGYKVSVNIDSECPAIQTLAENLTEVDALGEISFRRGLPETLQKGSEYCTHAACPVPIGVLKAIEVAAGLALPKDVTIKVEK